MQSTGKMIMIFCNTGDRESAEKIASALIEGKLAACVNILPGVVSIYSWQGKIERSEEYTLLIKTGADLAAAAEERILALHSYDTPEILAVDMASGNEKYLSWMREVLE